MHQIIVFTNAENLGMSREGRFAECLDTLQVPPSVLEWTTRALSWTAAEWCAGATIYMANWVWEKASKISEVQQINTNQSWWAWIQVPLCKLTLPVDHDREACCLNGLKLFVNQVALSLNFVPSCHTRYHRYIHCCGGGPLMRSCGRRWSNVLGRQQIRAAGDWEHGRVLCYSPDVSESRARWRLNY